MASSTRPGRPRLGEVLAAADGWCQPVVVEAGGRPWSAADLATLDGLVDHVEASRLGVERLCDVLAGRGSTGW